MEKLGIETEQLKGELQDQYNNLRQREHDLLKTGAPAPDRAQVANEIEQIKQKLDELSK